MKLSFLQNAPRPRWFDMSPEQAREIIGNQPAWAVRRMVHALSLLPWLNTAEEDQRLEAAKIVLALRQG